ncbi:MAG: DMT family transporter [Aggregatilineales bacterium]
MITTHRTPAVAWHPYAALVIGLAAVSAASSLIRLAQDDGAPSLGIAAWRLTLAALVLTPFTWLRHRAELRRISLLSLLLAVGSGAFLALHFATWVTSLAYTSVINAVALVNLHPILVALASPLLLHERLSRNTWIGLGLALFGSAIISLTGGAGTAPIHSTPLLGDGLALLGAVGTAGYFLIGRRVRASVGLVPYIWLTYTSAAVILLILCLFTGANVSGLPTSAYVWMTLLALLPQLIGHTSFNYALGFVPAAYVSLTVLGEPIGSIILAYFIFTEHPGILQIVGMALILVALWLCGRAEQESPVDAISIIEASE